MIFIDRLILNIILTYFNYILEYLIKFHRIDTLIIIINIYIYLKKKLTNFSLH